MRKRNKMKNNKITWTDEKTRKLFADTGLAEFADITGIQENSVAKTRIMREHRDRNTGEVNRRMTEIKLNGQVFYLKYACGSAFENIRNEFNALEILPQFNLTPPTAAAYAFDNDALEGWILFKALAGRFSIKEIITGVAPQEAIDDFLERKVDILESIAGKIREVHKNGYAYPDWFAKHLYIQPDSDEIVLIDLERFRPLAKSPWYFGFPITSLFVKSKFWRKLRNSLKSDILPDKLLKKILKEH